MLLCMCEHVHKGPVIKIISQENVKNKQLERTGVKSTTTWMFMVLYQGEAHEELGTEI